MAECVNLGVKAAREWCAQQGVPLLHEGVQHVTEAPHPPTSLRFTEEMSGHAAPGATDPREGEARGREQGTRLDVRLTLQMADLDLFITHPDHEARATGWVESPLIGGRRPVEDGTVNLLVHDADPAHKQMRYRLFFTNAAGEPCTLAGTKEIHDDGGMDIWSDTTTLYTTIWSGHVAGSAGAAPLAAGVMRIKWFDFLQQLTTFEAEAPTLGQRIAAINRFGVFFFGRIWDVFLRQFVEFGPM
jgi:hypothetical protein